MNHRGDRIGTAGDDRFNAAIAAVAYPAADAQSLRRVRHVIAETDALNKAGNDQAARFHLH